MSNSSRQVPNPSECLMHFQKLPVGLRQSAERIAGTHLASSRKVLHFLEKVCKHHRDATYEQKKAATCLALLHYHSALEVATEANLHNLECYTEDGSDPITIHSLLKTGTNLRLFRASHKHTGEQYVVKIYESSKRTTKTENDAYRLLSFPRPCKSTRHFLWGCPVLVMEVLEPLDKTDDPYKVGVSVLQQLRFIHRFGVHCDLKPDNIMKSVNRDGKVEYIVIDYGGMATTRVKYGWKRWVWSPRWTCQPRHNPNGGEVICTAKHDFKELAHTLKTLQNDIRGIPNKVRDGFDPIRQGFTGRLLTFLNAINAIRDDEAIPLDMYQRLISILDEECSCSRCQKKLSLPVQAVDASGKTTHNVSPPSQNVESAQSRKSRRERRRRDQSSKSNSSR